MPCQRVVPSVPGHELRGCPICPIRPGPGPGGELRREALEHRQVSAWDRGGAWHHAMGAWQARGTVFQDWDPEEVSQTEGEDGGRGGPP